MICVNIYINYHTTTSQHHKLGGASRKKQVSDNLIIIIIHPQVTITYKTPIKLLITLCMRYLGVI
jgi:hypothetical protein